MWCDAMERGGAQMKDFRANCVIFLTALLLRPDNYCRCVCPKPNTYVKNVTKCNSLQNFDWSQAIPSESQLWSMTADHVVQSQWGIEIEMPRSAREISWFTSLSVSFLSRSEHIHQFIVGVLCLSSLLSSLCDFICAHYRHTTTTM